MLDWVPEGHAVRVVIGTVERLMTRGLTGRLVPPSPAGSAAGPARYDPVMLLTVWMYACLRGVLSTRAVEDRCRYDATFRVACGPPAAVALAAAQLRLEEAIAAEQATLAGWQARRDGGQRVTRPPVRPGAGKKARRARARLAELQAEAAAEADGQATADGDGEKKPRRNVTDPDSRLLPVRGGGFIQGCNCQDAAADDRLMLGGYACQDTGDVQQAQELARVAGKGAAVVAAAHAAHAADPALLADCHGRMCTLPGKEKNDPGHDIAACHHAMTGRIGTLVEDAGYHSEANLTAPGPDRLIADAKTRDLARREPAQGPPPDDATAVQANAHRLATPEGRALCKRRAPDVEGLHASLKDRGGLRRFSLRGLPDATSEFLFAGLAHNLRLLAAIS